jgi:hypothetical protein
MHERNFVRILTALNFSAFFVSGNGVNLEPNLIGTDKSDTGIGYSHFTQT